MKGPKKMGHFKGGKLRRLVAGVGSATLALTMLAGVAAHAVRADEEGPAGPVAVDNIIAGTKGSVTLYKFKQPDPARAAATGLEQPTTGLTALKGVQFKLELADGYDLTTPEGWAAIDGLTAATVPTSVTWTDKGTVATGDAGMIKWADLPIGLYRVTEVGDTGDNHIVNPSAPFLLTIPMPINNEWTYDIFVYPKNAVTEVSKTVNDADAHAVGDEVSWTVTAAAPVLTAGDELKKLVVSDTFDPRLEYVEAKDVKYNGVALEAGDYTVTPVGQTVTVALTDTGLAKVKATSGKNLEVTFVTKVKELGNGVITNQAFLNTNVNDNEINTPSNEPETKFGALKIKKQDATSKNGLVGAKFRVFASEADAKTGTNPISVDVDGTPTDTFVTGNDGTVVIPGLKVNNGATSDRDYWIVETKAPAGYQPLTDPIKVTVTAGDVANAVIAEVDNTKKPKFDLPLTGSTGTMIFLVGGGLLVALGAVLALVARKRKNA